MWLTRLRQQIMTFLSLSAAVFIFLQLLACWWSSVHIGVLRGLFHHSGPGMHEYFSIRDS